MTRSERFAHEQKLAMDARPRIHVRSVHVEEAAGRNGYAVRIDGDNLHEAIAPPQISVGGEIVGDLKFSGDGGSISGTVPKKPRSRHTVVDYGFAKAEME
jgi:hypothetical protein